MAQSPINDPAFVAAMTAEAASVKAERSDQMALAEEHMARVRYLDAKLAALETLIKDALASPASGSPRPRHVHSEGARAVVVHEDTWGDFIMGQLSGINGGRSYRELLAATAGTPFAERHARSPNAFYNAVGSLVAQGRVVRRNKIVYRTEVLSKIEAGEIEEERPEAEPDFSMPDLIVRALRGATDGMKAGDIVEAVRVMPEAAERLSKNTQIVYATLSRMAQSGMLERNYKGSYRLPDASASAASSPNVTPFPGAGRG